MWPEPGGVEGDRPGAGPAVVAEVVDAGVPALAATQEVGLGGLGQGHEAGSVAGEEHDRPLPPHAVGLQAPKDDRDQSVLVEHVCGPSLRRLLTGSACAQPEHHQRGQVVAALHGPGALSEVE
jgi:hypothetical protein